MQIRTFIATLTAAASIAGIAGQAAAQERVEAAPAAAPAWYSQFSNSTPATPGRAGAVDESAALDFQPSARWGVTLRMDERAVAPSVDAPKGSETSVRAYYQFTPRLRVGGEVQLGSEAAMPEGAELAGAQAEPEGHIKLESAFRF